MSIDESVGVLIGQTLESVVQDGVESLTFRTTEGKCYRLFHAQDCCESVTIDDVCGDLQNLIGSPILMAEESVGDAPQDVATERAYSPESETWTFYKFATAKGYVTVRWYGESNGYYSESVDFCEVDW